MTEQIKRILEWRKVKKECMTEDQFLADIEWLLAAHSEAMHVIAGAKKMLHFAGEQYPLVPNDMEPEHKNCGKWLDKYGEKLK